MNLIWCSNHFFFSWSVVSSKSNNINYFDLIEIVNQAQHEHKRRFDFDEMANQAYLSKYKRISWVWFEAQIIFFLLDLLFHPSQTIKAKLIWLKLQIKSIKKTKRFLMCGKRHFFFFIFWFGEIKRIKKSNTYSDLVETHFKRFKVTKGVWVIWNRKSRAFFFDLHLSYFLLNNQRMV